MQWRTVAWRPWKEGRKNLDCKVEGRLLSLRLWSGGQIYRGCGVENNYFVVGLCSGGCFDAPSGTEVLSVQIFEIL